MMNQIAAVTQIIMNTSNLYFFILDVNYALKLANVPTAISVNIHITRWNKCITLIDIKPNIVPTSKIASMGFIVLSHTTIRNSNYLSNWMAWYRTRTFGCFTIKLSGVHTLSSNDISNLRHDRGCCVYAHNA